MTDESGLVKACVPEHARGTRWRNHRPALRSRAKGQSDNPLPFNEAANSCPFLLTRLSFDQIDIQPGRELPKLVRDFEM
jgi:hypothetical protein